MLSSDSLLSVCKLNRVAIIATIWLFIALYAHFRPPIIYIVSRAKIDFIVSDPPGAPDIPIQASPPL